MQTALVIGGGAFGTAISSILANNFEQVILQVRGPEIYRDLKNNRQNSRYLGNVSLSPKIIPALGWDEIDCAIDLMVFALPTHAIAAYLAANCDKLLEYLQQEIPVVSLSKGIDPQTLELADDLYFSHFAEFSDNFTFLSGPSFASEIVAEQITLVSLAGRSKRVLERVTPMLETSYFKALPGYDIKGTLLGGALKNILGIAGGIIEELGLNHNTRAAMITRGIAEMLRFGKVFNARPETFYGLSGMGDLILTTTGQMSRNKQFGQEVAKGRSPEEILKEWHFVVEGYQTTLAAHRLCQRYDIHARIFNGVYSVLYENAAPAEVIAQMMAAPTKFELD